MDSIAERLSNHLETIVGTMDRLLDASRISDERAHNLEMMNSGVVIIGMPDYRWGPADDTQRQVQRELLELWTPWIEQVRYLFSGDTNETQGAIAEAAESASAWIQRDNPRDHSVPSSIPEAKRIFRELLAPFSQLLRMVSSTPGEVIAVPDTNVLIRQPDITKYAGVLGTSKYVVLLTPAVLHEMDEHKVNHKNEGVRTKARAFSDRLKGWRKQGLLAKGVKVQGDIYVRVEGHEPDFENTLGWLDKDVADDRIIASILEAQRRTPSAKIVLLTGDTIMLAKSDAASIPTADTPDPEP